MFTPCATFPRPSWRREALAATAAALVAVPASIANGLVLFSPLGPQFTGAGALAGVVGAAVLGTLAPILGGTPGLVSAPSPAAAAFMAVVAAQLVARGDDLGTIPVQLAVVVAMAGVFQVAAGLLRCGRVVKYMPYPVIAGYLTGGGLLILHLQLGNMFGAPARYGAIEVLRHPATWNGAAITIAAVTLAVTVTAPRLTRRAPATMLGLGAGVLTHQLLSLRWPELRAPGGGFVVGALLGGAAGPGDAIRSLAAALSADVLRQALVPAATLAVLLSIDTLKTCLLVDGVAGTRHDSDRELVGQGLGNAASAWLGGGPGTGIVSGSMVNVTSGARTRWSGAFAGVLALATLIGLAPLIAALPIAALAAVVALMAWRMIQTELVELLRDRTTAVDFAVAAAVVVVAMLANLAAAAGAGLVMALLLFLRSQARSPVVRRVLDGGSVTAHRRGERDARVLERHAQDTLIVELQGSLFFGTADALAAELEPRAKDARFVILDLARVRSVDLTAVRALKPLATQLARRGGSLVICGAPEDGGALRLRSYVNRLGLSREPLHVELLPHMDDALEWAEERILGGERRSRPPMTLDEIPLIQPLPPEARVALSEVVRERAAPRGERVFAAGETGRELYLIRSGQLRVQVPVAGERMQILTVLGTGDFFGDLAYLDGAPRSADVVADTEVALYVLEPEAVARAAARAPGLETLVAARLATSLAERLRRATTEARRLRAS